ncbi:type II secretion system major pseudopilin GspG [Agaribacterium haliotis]|uniref:type II secretion system major pseudopilin GspG n=1 Tax=Agaribacterium haliotis TaxID=2013869 RepID=UPI000BB5748C|nr:type II secretion system major pseudopilin GspG [Agaribacterium haliotis]
MKIKQQGFSLIEIMVVLVIIGLLATMVGPRVFGVLSKGYEARVVSDFATIKTALTTYKVENYTFPTTEQGLEALVTEPQIDPKPRNWSGYLDKLPLDPWKNPYQYVSPADGRPFDVYTLGADGVRGGEAENADVSIWDEAP